MKRADNFAERGGHIANLTDQELYDRFWVLTEQVVALLLGLSRRSTIPSTERAALLRMGVPSLETQKIVEGCMDHNPVGHGAGCVVYKLSREKNLSTPEAGHPLVQGKCWDEAAVLFKKGK